MKRTDRFLEEPPLFYQFFKIFNVFYRFISGRCLFFDIHYLKLKRSLPADYVLHTQRKDKSYLSVVCIAHTEDEYLDEWINFHILMGVDHFFYYDNSCTSETKIKLSPYVEKGYVTHIQFPHIEGTRQQCEYYHKLSDQLLAYGHCITKLATNTTWLMAIDLDEFMYPSENSGYKSLVPLLQNLEREGYDSIEVNMHDFGSNWHKRKPDGIVIDNYSLKARSSRKEVKSIAKVSSLSKVPYSREHKFYYKNIIKRIIDKHKMLRSNESEKLIKLNHYVTKSMEEVELKSNKIWMKNKYALDKFLKNEPFLNEVEDNGYIKIFSSEVKEMITKNRHNP